MFDALQIAATGMHAQQQHVDSIANNLANVNTPGFKKARLSFTDLVSKQAVTAPDSSTGKTQASLGAPGAGVALAQIGRSFEPGEARATGSPYDITISGAGFIELIMPDGSSAYARGGTLHVSPDGQLVTAGGLPVKPGITIPDDTEQLTISQDGRVSVRTAGKTHDVEVGRIDLVRFVNPSALEAVGDGAYKATEGSGEPVAGRTGEEDVGALRQGFLEGSNVKLVEEMVNLMVAQRAYEASVKVAQASDEMLGMVNNLRK